MIRKKMHDGDCIKRSGFQCGLWRLIRIRIRNRLRKLMRIRFLMDGLGVIMIGGIIRIIRKMVRR